MSRIEDFLVLTPKISPTHADVAVIVSIAPVPSSAWTVSGEIYGPFCQRAKTIRVRVKLDARTSGDFPELEARVPEPCFWEPQHPFLYDLALQLQVGGSVLDRIETQFGVRHLSNRSNQIFFNGVPRRFTVADAPDSEHALPCWIGAESEQLYREAGQVGLGIIHRLPSSPDAALRELVRLRNLPAILLWAVDQTLWEENPSFQSELARSDPSRPIALSGPVVEGASKETSHIRILDNPSDAEVLCRCGTSVILLRSPDDGDPVADQISGVVQEGDLGTALAIRSKVA